MLLIAILVIFLILFSFYELCRKSGVNIAEFLKTFALKNISIALVAQMGIYACLSLNGVFLSKFVLKFDIPFMQNYIKSNNRWEHFRDNLVYVDYEHFRKAPLAKMYIYNNNESQMSCHFNRSELLYGSHEDDFTPHRRDTRYIGEDISIYYSFYTEGRTREWFWMKDGHRVDTSSWRMKVNDIEHVLYFITKELQIYMLNKEDFGEYVLVEREVLEESKSSLSVTIYDKYRYRFVLSEQEENIEYFEVPVGGLFALDFGRFYVLNGSNDLTLKHTVNSKLIERVPQSCLLSVFVYSLFYFRTILQPVEKIAPFSEEYWSNGMMRLVSVGCFSADHIGVHKIVIERCISFGKCSKCFNITHPTTHIISATSGSHPFSSYQTNESKTWRLLSKYFVDERTANMRVADSNRSAPFSVTPSGPNDLAQRTISGNDSPTELAHEWLKYYQQSEYCQYVKIATFEFLFVIFLIWIWPRFVWLVRLLYILLDMIPGHILEQSRRHLELRASKQEPQKTFEVFISYAPFCDEDYSFVVNKLYPVLNECNVKVLLDREQSCTGLIASFYKWAVSVSRKMLVVVSDDYINDNDGFFLQYERNILPKLRNKSISTEDVFIIKRDACLIPDSILNIENLRSMDWVEGNNENVCLGTLKKWATRQNSCYQNAKIEVLLVYLKAVNILNNRFG